MGATIPDKAACRAAAMASIDALEARFTRNVERLVRDVDAFIKAKTPVNTGQAVRNMVWHVGLNGDGRVYEAEGTMDPGPTNSMSLGAEPRRGINEAAAGASLAALNFTSPFTGFVLENNSPDIMGLELGIYPGAPLTPRSPQGMFGLAHAFFFAKLSAKGILS